MCIYIYISMCFLSRWLCCLQEVKVTCEQKAKDYEERMKLRDGETMAITKAQTRRLDEPSTRLDEPGTRSRSGRENRRPAKRCQKDGREWSAAHTDMA